MSSEQQLLGNEMITIINKFAYDRKTSDSRTDIRGIDVRVRTFLYLAVDDIEERMRCYELYVLMSGSEYLVKLYDMIKQAVRKSVVDRQKPQIIEMIGDNIEKKIWEDYYNALNRGEMQ